jgi:O-antigen/teichoic acid export membrane protein
LSQEQVRVFSGTLYNYLTLIILVALTAINTIIIADSIGTNLYGGYSIATTILDLLTALCAVGMGASLVRFVPDFLIRKKFSSVNTTINTASVIILTVTVILSVVFFLLSPFIATNIFHDYWVTSILQLMVIIFPLISINFIFGLILSGFQRFGLYMIVKITFISFYLLSVLAFLYFGFSIDGVIYAFAIGYTVSDLLGFIFSLREKRKRVQSNVKSKIFDFGLFKEMLNFGKWDFGSNFANLGFTRFNELLIGVFLTVAVLGVYSISQTFASILGYIGAALGLTLQPYLSELTAIKRKKKVVNLVKSSTRYSLVLSLLFSAPVIVFSYQIFQQFFTSGFLLGVGAANILIIGFVISNISNPVSSYFFARKKLWVNFSILVASLLTGLILSILLIPRLSMNGLNQTAGLFGAAIALVAGWIVNTVLYAFFTKRYFEISILEKKSAIWAIIFLAGISVLALLTYINFEYSVLGLVVFEVALALKYKHELRNFAKTAEAYMLPSQKKVITNR